MCIKSTRTIDQKLQQKLLYFQNILIRFFEN